MTDAEMMRWAAKAAGAEMTDYSDRTPDHWIVEKSPRLWVEWNPLKNDADAFRLMVALGVRDLQSCFWNQVMEEGFIDDSLNTMRRAIVRAAADIRKEMGDAPSA